MKVKKGFAPAMGILLYVILFAQLIIRGEQLFPHINKSYGPIMFLTLFCFSALTCGLIVFYQPYLLFIDKKAKEAGELVLTTAKWLGVFALVTIAFVVVMSR